MSSFQAYTQENVGKYIKLTERDVAKFLPEGLGGHLLAREFQSTHTQALLIRQPIVDAINLLKDAEHNAFSETKAPRPTVFFGERGSGKSAAIVQVVYWARKSGWLVFYIPNGFEVTSGGDFIEKSPFSRNQVLWDDPSTSFRILNNFLTAHAEKLKEISLKTKYAAKKLAQKRVFPLARSNPVLLQDSLWENCKERPFLIWLSTELRCLSSQLPLSTICALSSPESLSSPC